MTRTDDGMEIFDNQIESLFVQFFQDNGMGEQLEAHKIDDSHAYGAWRYIYNTLFKPDKNTIRLNNKTSKLDYSDVYGLFEIADIYIDLCFKYKIYPLMNDFCAMTGISRDTLNSWERGEYRAGKAGASVAHSDLVKKIKAATQLMTVKDLHGNPIGQQSLANNFDDAGLMFTQKEIRAQAEANMLSQLSREEIAARWQAQIEFKEEPEQALSVDDL